MKVDDRTKEVILTEAEYVELVNRHLSEEPVSESIDFEQELYKAFGQIKDFTLGIAIAKRFYDMGRKHKEPVSEELLDTTQTITYNGEVYIRRYKDELDAFACKYPMSVPKTSKKYAKYSDVDLTIAVKAGAQWQKEVFEKNRLAACDRATKEEIEREQDFVDKVLIGEQRQPTFSDAIEYGIKWQKQQTIDKACEFFIEHCGYIDTASYDLDDVINNFRKALKKE